jgi:hypothetical protein
MLGRTENRIKGHPPPFSLSLYLYLFTHPWGKKQEKKTRKKRLQKCGTLHCLSFFVHTKPKIQTEDDLSTIQMIDNAQLQLCVYPPPLYSRTDKMHRHISLRSLVLFCFLSKVLYSEWDKQMVAMLFTSSADSRLSTKNFSKTAILIWTKIVIIIW